MAKHAPKPVWAQFVAGPLARRLRIGVASGTLLALVAGGIGWAIAGDPEPGSLPLRPPPSLELNAPPTHDSNAGAGSHAPPTGRPTPTAGEMAPATRRTPPAPRRTGRSAPPTRPATTSPRRTTTATAPAASGGLTTRYMLGSSWDSGLVAGVIVGNPTRASHRFEVRLTYPADYQVRVLTAWNATVRSSSGTIVLAGGPLQAGGQIMVGFQATKARPSQANPTSCTVAVVTG